MVNLFCIAIILFVDYIIFQVAKGSWIKVNKVKRTKRRIVKPTNSVKSTQKTSEHFMEIPRVLSVKDQAVIQSDIEAELERQ